MSSSRSLFPVVLLAYARRTTRESAAPAGILTDAPAEDDDDGDGSAKGLAASVAPFAANRDTHIRIIV